MLSELLIVSNQAADARLTGWKEVARVGATRALARGEVSVCEGPRGVTIAATHDPASDPDRAARRALDALTRGVSAEEAVAPRAPEAVALVAIEAGAGAFAVARDPVGMVPWVWRESGGAIALSTRPDMVHHALGLPARPDAKSCQVCLDASSSSRLERDLFEGARRILPGHLVAWAPGQASLRARRWWAPVRGGIEDHAGALLEALERGLEPALSAREVVAEVSGGLDSSGLAAMLARERPGVDAVALRAPGLSNTDDGKAIERFTRASPVRLLEVDMRDLWPVYLGEVGRVLPSLGPIFSATEEMTEAMLTRCSARERAAIVVSGVGADQLFDVPHGMCARGHVRARDRRALDAYAKAFGEAALRNQVALAALEPLGVSARVRRARAFAYGAGLPAEGLSERLRHGVHHRDMATLGDDPGGWLLRSMETWGWELMVRGLRRRAALSWPARHVYPFLDPRVWEVALSSPARCARGPTHRLRWVSKHALRVALERHGALHRMLVWRPKVTNFDAIVCRGFAAGEYAAQVEDLRGLDGLADLVDVGQARRELDAFTARAVSASGAAVEGVLRPTRLLALEGWSRGPTAAPNGT